MAVAGTVVGEHALLGGGLDILEARTDAALRVADVLGFGERRRALEDIERRPGVAAGERDEVLEGVVAEADPAVGAERPGQPALLVAERPTDDGPDLVVGQCLEPPDAHPRQERRVDLEVRVLGRGADQRDGPVLDVGEEGVLLGLVEAMDLVEEEDAPRAVEIETLLRLGDRGADLDDARHDRRQRREVGADLGREQAGEAGLAGPGRSPQQQRGEVAAGDPAPERATLTDEVLLADELVEVPWAHARGERLRLGRGMEEGLGSCAGRPPGGWHEPMVSRWRRATATVRSEDAEPGEVNDEPEPQQEEDQRRHRRSRCAGRHGRRRRTPRRRRARCSTRRGPGRRRRTVTGSPSSWPLRRPSPRRGSRPRARRRAPLRRRSGCRVGVPRRARRLPPALLAGRAAWRWSGGRCPGRDVLPRDRLAMVW